MTAQQIAQLYHAERMDYAHALHFLGLLGYSPLGADQLLNPPF